MLFLLKRTVEYVGPDENIEMVIRAKDSKEARKLANAEAMDEGRIWEDPALVRCRQIRQEGHSHVVVCSSRSV